MRGWAESYAWTPADRDNPRLEPHLWLLDKAHQPGAIKALDGLLELVPGLEEAVHEAAGYPLLIDSLRREA
jgi:hypothetical protein